LRIAHFSDLHFSHFIKNPIQFFSKTWIGNANLLLKRGQRLQPPENAELIHILKQIQPDICVISGDFTTTSQKNEFMKAQKFIQQLEQEGLRILKIPGNHDHYTKKAHKKKIFYQYLSNACPLKTGELKEDGYEIHIVEDCAILLLDLTLATPWFTAYGHFNHKLEAKLDHALSALSPDKKIIACGHFPLFNKDLKPSNSLKNSSALFDLLSKHQVSAYLHGHNHKFTVLKKKGLFHIDSGSISDIHKGSFNILETDPFMVTPYFRHNGKFYKETVHG
jgi:3',5'-cyclic AMP phosphodiesterase CpdA